jgi:tRNA(adenine34) deaminase
MHLTKKNILFINTLYAHIKKNADFEIPIGALIIKNNKIVSLKKNIQNKNEPLGHAECLAIKDTIKKYGNKNLSDCILFTSLEPCLMCSGAAMHSNIKIIYYLCKSYDTGIQTKFNIHCIPNLAIIPLLIYENEINALIKSFFTNKRSLKI